MFRLTVLYPSSDNTSFDLDYYRTTHVELVRRELEPHGILALEWDSVIAGRAGLPPPFYVASHQIWPSQREFQAAVDDGAFARIAEDVPNFYSEHSVVFVSDMHRHWTRGRGEQ